MSDPNAMEVAPGDAPVAQAGSSAASSSSSAEAATSAPGQAGGEGESTEGKGTAVATGDAARVKIIENQGHELFQEFWSEKWSIMYREQVGRALKNLTR